jgi:hypothetical protein
MRDCGFCRNDGEICVVARHSELVSESAVKAVVNDKDGGWEVRQRQYCSFCRNDGEICVVARHSELVSESAVKYDRKETTTTNSRY